MANLPEAVDEYRAKFGDYPPRHAFHGEDPEGEMREAVKTGDAIPEELPGNTVRDDQ